MSEPAVEYKTEEKKSQVKEGLNIGEMFWEWVFIEPISDPDEVKGIKIPEVAKDVVTKGFVLACGPDGDKNIKVGDKVLFKRRSALNGFDLDGRKVLVFKKDQILGILFGDDAEDVTPLSENVFLYWEFGSKYYGGTDILRPDSHKTMHHTGLIRAIGPDVKQFKVEDRVMFDQFSRAEHFEDEGRRYVFIKEKDIYCTVPVRSGDQLEAENKFESQVESVARGWR